MEIQTTLFRANVAIFILTNFVDLRDTLVFISLLEFYNETQMRIRVT
jgi:hypothetical protein